MFHWPLGWYSSYSATQLVTRTSERKQNKTSRPNRCHTVYLCYLLQMLSIIQAKSVILTWLLPTRGSKRELWGCHDRRIASQIRVPQKPGKGSPQRVQGLRWSYIPPPESSNRSRMTKCGSSCLSCELLPEGLKNELSTCHTCLLHTCFTLKVRGLPYMTFTRFWDFPSPV